jgi:hypothetical protein
MPPILAFVLTVVFIGFLIRRDLREKPNVTGALWIPLLWLSIICSRAVSQWLALAGFQVGGVSLEEGSPVDAVVYFALLALGIRVRHIRHGLSKTASRAGGKFFQGISSGRKSNF